MLVGPDEYQHRPGNHLGAIAYEVYPIYQQMLRDANVVDFDDLLMYNAHMLRENDDLRGKLDAQFRYVLVDEYQDTNLAQYTIARSISVQQPNLAVTGDPDQSIYSWRGADIRNILEFERDYPSVSVIRLEENFRSCEPILRVADQLISNNQERREKTLIPIRQGGVPVRLMGYESEKEEGQDIASQIAHRIHAGASPSDFAVFYRNNRLSRAVEHAFSSLGIPYQMVRGTEFYQRKEVKDVIAYLQLLYNPRHDGAFLRAINSPPRGIGKKTLERLTEYARSERLPMLEAARLVGTIGSINGRYAVQVAAFVSLIDGLAAYVHDSLETLVTEVLIRTDYVNFWKRMESEEGNERAGNLEELIGAARDFDETNLGEDCLELFLQETSLVADIDAWDEESERVTMMTLHASKGLEFPNVYIVGVEDGILPNKIDDNPNLEEERRLLFVGITRAKNELQLSWARRRVPYDRRTQAASPFLMELPRDEMERHGLDAMQVTSFGIISRDLRDLDEAIQWTPEMDDDPRFAQSEDVAVWDTSFDTASFENEPPDQPSSSAARYDEFAAEAHDAEHQDLDPAGQIRDDVTGGGHAESGADGMPVIQTGAELFSEEQESLPRSAPEDYRVGSIVRHVTYGLGRITKASGKNAKRRVDVTFFEGQVERSLFVQFAKMHVVSGVQ